MNRKHNIFGDRRERVPENGTRRGVSLLIVMVTISISVVLTLSFIRTQSANLQIHHNTSGRELARSAAQTGAAVALQQIGSTTWGGIDSNLTANIHSDAAGDTSYSVEFLALDESRMTPLPDDLPLYLVVKSTGRWQSRDNASDVVERTVELIVHLEPRVPGRAVHPGDSSSAADVAPNPGDYDSIQQFALFAASGSTSLVLDPQDRIEGNVWLKSNLQLYGDPKWSSTIRGDYLSSVGSKYVSGSVFQHPHPLSGQITFRDSPGSSVTSDLLKLKIPWTTTSATPAVPSIDYSAWTTYQLYEGGPTYTAQNVGSYLSSVTLRPTATNPLGIFYRAGSITIDDNVIVQGTIVSTDTVTISGENARLCSYNWKGDGDKSLVPNATHWPRLPAIVANRVSIDRSIRAAIEGAIVVAKTLTGAGGDFEYFSTTNVNITGTAVCTPQQQPWSTIKLQQNVNLSAVSDNGRYEIWLQNGSSGNWYTIVGVDSANLELRVLGEVRHQSPVAFRIRPGRYRFADIRGPISGESFNINRPESWGTLNSTVWYLLWSSWRSINYFVPSFQLVDFLLDPNNFLGLGLSYPQTSYGLPLEPTFHARNTTGISYRWSPPLFLKYTGTGAQAEFSGYRWRVVSWRHVP